MRWRAAVCERQGEALNCFGTRIDTPTLGEAVSQMERWIAAGAGGHCVVFANVHVVMEARRNQEFAAALRGASLALPDGTPLGWVAKLRGVKAEKLSGPDFLIEFCRRTQHKNYRHYFYGAAPGVADELAERLRRQFPEIQIAGTFSPPYRTLTTQEDDAIVQQINATKPDMIWVGLGCPKQERWMQEHASRLCASVLLGVGQAFDIHAGRLKRAPAWMRASGLEWLFRLCSEPRRLWRRYLVYNTGFVLLWLRSIFAHQPEEQGS